MRKGNVASIQVPVIPVEQLVLDDNNPRFADSISQDEMLLLMAKDEKIASLAKHIADHGLDPTNTPGAIRLPGSKVRYLIREGNRRLGALKLLNNPTLAGTATFTKKFRKIADEAKVPIPKGLPCVIFDGDDADEWIALKHSGPQNGEGTLQWDAMQRSRFNVRTGRNDQNLSAQRLLQHSIDNNWLTKTEVDAIGVTNLTRLLNDADVQAVWGVHASDNGLSFGIPKLDMKKFVKRMSTDWRKRSGAKKVADIYEKPDRLKYARAVVKELGIKPSTGTTTVIGEESAGGRGSGSKLATTKGRVLKSSVDRATLVPRQFVISIDADRAHNIYLELRKLHVEDYPNAVAVLFRTFVEISTDNYAVKHNIAFKQDETLAGKVQRVCQHLKAAGVHKNIVDPVEQTVATKGLFSIKTFNQYVHNILHHPTPTDLKTKWDTFSPYMAKVWE